MMNDAKTSLDLVAYQINEYQQFDFSIVPATPRREWMSFFNDHPYRCLPLVMANQMGWFLLNPVGFTAEWQEDSLKGFIDIQYDEPVEPKDSYLGRYFGNGILTWHFPFLFRTPPHYNLLVRGPANWIKDGIQPLEGMVETDWTEATFTMNWKFTRAGQKVRFEKDEPFCMITPFRRGELEQFQPQVIDIREDPQTNQAYEVWDQKRQTLKTEVVMRSQIARALKHDFKPTYHLDYFRGEHASGGEPFPEHQTRLNLKHFSALWKSKVRSLMNFWAPEEAKDAEPLDGPNDDHSNGK